MASRSRKAARIRRKMRVRKKVRGTADKPRLSVFRSARHIYAQLIDDETAGTIATMSSMNADVRDLIQNNSGNCRGAAVVGEHIAKKALEKGIKTVVFDRNGFLYHGRVKTLAEAAREHGLVF